MDSFFCCFMKGSLCEQFARGVTHKPLYSIFLKNFFDLCFGCILGCAYGCRFRIIDCFPTHNAGEYNKTSEQTGAKLEPPIYDIPMISACLFMNSESSFHVGDASGFGAESSDAIVI
jgi:hypothetical protein